MLPEHSHDIAGQLDGDPSLTECAMGDAISGLALLVLLVLLVAMLSNCIVWVLSYGADTKNQSQAPHP